MCQYGYKCGMPWKAAARKRERVASSGATLSRACERSRITVRRSETDPTVEGVSDLRVVEDGNTEGVVGGGDSLSYLFLATGARLLVCLPDRLPLRFFAPLLDLTFLGWAVGFLKETLRADDGPGAGSGAWANTATENETAHRPARMMEPGLFMRYTSKEQG